MTLAAKNIESPDMKVNYEHGDLNIVDIGGMTIARAVLSPGWSWSTDLKEDAGTDSCQLGHTGLVMSGHLGVRMDDGTEAEFGPGDAHVIGPGHDAWVVGDEPVVLVDFAETPAS